MCLPLDIYSEFLISPTHTTAFECPRLCLAPTKGGRNTIKSWGFSNGSGRGLSSVSGNNGWLTTSMCFLIRSSNQWPQYRSPSLGEQGHFCPLWRLQAVHSYTPEAYVWLLPRDWGWQDGSSYWERAAWWLSLPPLEDKSSAGSRVPQWSSKVDSANALVARWGHRLKVLPILPSAQNPLVK